MTAATTIDDVELPAVGVWDIDPGHAELAFVGRHLGLTKVRGRFTGVTGRLDLTDDLEDARLDVTIDMDSVSSGDPARDDHLRSGDFFDVAAHPHARFASTRIEQNGSAVSVTGDLEIKGVSRSVTLDVVYLGHAVDPWGTDRAVFSASAVINREDWGLTWNMLLDTGGLLVSKQIRIEVEVELTRGQGTSVANG